MPIHDPAWLRANSDAIDRVLYQMGNSPFHNYMRDLMVEVPGTLVLHDFFLSGLFSWLEQVDPSCGTWTRALYRSHGYIAVRDRYRDAEATRMCYPVNLGIVQAAQGVIVHSEHARMLAAHVQVAAGRKPDPSRDGGAEIGQDVAEQIVGDDHVESGRVVDEEHRRGIDVLVLDPNVRKVARHGRDGDRAAVGMIAPK